MPEYIKLEGNLGGTCLTCADYAPPMWYLRELPDGTPALMCRGCIEQLGRQIGMLTFSDVATKEAPQPRPRRERAKV